MKYNNLTKIDTRILLVDASERVLLFLNKILKKRNYTAIIEEKNCSEAIEFLNNNKIDWVISSSFANEKNSILDLLKIIRHNQGLKETVVTLLADKGLDSKFISMC